MSVNVRGAHGRGGILGGQERAVDGVFVSTGKTYKNDSEFAGLARAGTLFQD
ncbi:MAG TPA: hypothetical protein VEQ16_06025 [Acidocella sp.]|jgi:hypothetical protein|nr:hypothetical protein [Acidocella sp.]